MLTSLPRCLDTHIFSAFTVALKMASTRKTRDKKDKEPKIKAEKPARADGKGKNKVSVAGKPASESTGMTLACFETYVDSRSSEPEVGQEASGDRC